MDVLILTKNNTEIKNCVYTITCNNKKTYLECIQFSLRNKLRILCKINEIYTFQIFGIIPRNYNIYLKRAGAVISTSFKKIQPLSSSKNYVDEYTNPKKIQWDVIRTTNNYESHRKAKGSHSHSVGIIDSGIDINHQDLVDNILSIRNFVPHQFPNQDGEFKVDPLYMKDYLDHGTQVAGQICANGEITSIAPNTGIKIYRVFGEREGYNIWIIDAIIHAANDGVDVINLSLGSYLLDGDYKKNGEWNNNNSEIIAFKKAITYAYQKGCVVVGSLGNDSINIDDQKILASEIVNKKDISDIQKKSQIYDFPCQIPNVFGVAAANYFDKISSYSNKSNLNLDILSYAGDYSLLEKYGRKEWLNKKYITKDWILSTSSETVYTYTTGNSLATAKVSAAIAAMNDYYNIEKQPSKSISLIKSKSNKILNMSNLVSSDLR